MIARRRKFLKLGLLPRMDVYERKDGSYTYRFKNYDGTYTKLGNELVAAKQKALELLNGRPVAGSLAELVQTYFRSTAYKGLAPRTQKDYEADSKPVVRVFGRMDPNDIRAPHIARYLRVERAEAPVRANREMAFLSTVFQFGIEQGVCEANPCRQVRRNKETPRSVKPETASIEGLLQLARKRGRASRVAALIACTVAASGNRRQDVLRITDFNLSDAGLRVTERKRKANEAERVRLVEWSDTLRDLIAEAMTLRPAGCTYIFATEAGDPYTDRGFKANWSRLVRAWRDAGGQVFTAHDMRAYFVTEKVERGEDPETHKNKGTQTTVYDRRRIKRTKALDF